MKKVDPYGIHFRIDPAAMGGVSIMLQVSLAGNIFVVGQAGSKNFPTTPPRVS